MTNGLLDHPRARETNERTRFGDVQIAKHREARRDSAGGRIGEDADIRNFLFIQPHTPKAKVLTRVITSPSHLKRLVAALKDNLDKYEARFGPIAAGENAAAKPSGYYQ